MYIVKEVISLAIAANKRERVEMGEDLLAGYGLRQYCEMFCTVRIDTGRASGKSFAIAQLVRQGDLVICQYPYLSPSRSKPVDVLGETSRELYRGTTERYDTIYIDEPHTLPKFDVYKLFLKDKDQTFVFVGN